MTEGERTDTSASRGADVVGRHRRLVRRTALVSLLTLVSRVLGLVREVISAALFGGSSGIYDAFITAWRVPNLFRRFLGEGAISTSFQTALTEADAHHGERAGAALFQATARSLLAVLLALLAVSVACIHWLPDEMPVTGWRWLGADPEAVRDLAIRLMPFVVMICLAALVTGALHVRGVFGPPAWAPAVLNVIWIGALVVVAVEFGVHGPAPADDGGARHLAMTHWLAWGVLLSGLAQLAVQVPALARVGLLRRVPGPLPAGAPRVGTVIKRAAPLAFGAAVYQVNVMVDGLMAEALPDGGPTAHYLANRVQQFPLALVAIAATSAVFPLLQAQGQKGDRAAVRSLHDQAHLGIAFVALPAAFGLGALSVPVTEAVFGHGAFGSEGVGRTAAALRMLCVAILPAGAAGLIARTYYSMGDFRTPVRISVVMLAANIVLNALFLFGLGMDVDGLALATTITSAGSVALLWPGLTRKLRLPPSEVRLISRLLRTTLASAVSGGVAFGVHFIALTLLGEFLALGAAIAAGVSAHIATALLLGVPEAQTVRTRLTAKLRR